MRGWYVGDFIADHPRFVACFIIFAGSFSLILLVTKIIPATIGAQVNFQTLRGELAKVHLPSGYRLTGEHQAGTNCHEECSLTQTWTGAPVRSTKGSACSDVFNALNSAFSGVEPDSPLPADAACDYFVNDVSFAHPGQGKPSITAIVQTGNDRAGGDLIVTISAAYE